MYGLEKAFEEVSCAEDWKQPKGKKDGSSKVRWALRDRYSVKALLAGSTKIVGADEEVRKQMETDALFQKYLSKSTLGKGKGDGEDE